MSKMDWGTIIWATVAGIGGVLAWAAHWAKAGLERMRASFVALVSSPAVWLAVGVMFVAGFWLGHIEGSAGKSGLRSQVAGLRVSLIDANARATAAAREAQAWKAKAEAPEASTPPKSEPVAAVVKRPVPKKPAEKKAASEAKKPFWPFQ